MHFLEASPYPSQLNSTSMLEPSPFETLETSMIDLANRAENISNTFKNLGEIITIDPDQPVENEVGRMIADFLKAAQQDLKVEIFLFGQKHVPDLNNRSSILRMSAFFQGSSKEAWRKALHDYLSSKQDEMARRIHICDPLSQAISAMKTVKEADRIAFYLMSEICSTQGAVRSFDFIKLTSLVGDPLIQPSPMLIKSVLKAAKDVQCAAIRKKQSNIIWQVLTDKQDKQKWDEAAKKKGLHVLHDFEGIYQIAREANLSIAKIETLKEKITQTAGSPDHALHKFLIHFEALQTEMGKLNTFAAMIEAPHKENSCARKSHPLSHQSASAALKRGFFRSECLPISFTIYRFH